MVLVNEISAKAINTSLIALGKPNTVFVTEPVTPRGVNISLNSVSNGRIIYIADLTINEINSALIDLFA